ncbi:hypothetical protein [Candidatus Methylocalor cossyra]|uniref:Uncharacterized protein n=1 Tax=Candidatus Methylocalor cossyra TaxID=3108543 RepID=A0ABM9NHH7_9GAMM
MTTTPLALKRIACLLLGGRWGILAWGLSLIAVVAVALWDAHTLAMPLLMIKTASWGFWGFGIVRERKMRAALACTGPGAET